MSETPQHTIHLTHTLQRGHVWELRECELTEEAAGGIRLCMRTSSPGQGGDTYECLYRWLRELPKKSPPESISLLNLSGLALFDAERLAGALRRTLSEQLHSQALQPEERNSNVRLKWGEGNHFLALAWCATTERQRFSRAAFLTAWKWMDSQGRAVRRLAVPLVMDGGVTIVGAGHLGLTPRDVDVLARVRALTFHYLTRKNTKNKKGKKLTPEAYAKALGKMVKAWERGGLLTPRRYATLDEVRSIPGIAPSGRGREPMSRPRIWESVVAAASEHFLDCPGGDRPQTRQRKCPGSDHPQTQQPKRPAAGREQLKLDLPECR